MLFSEQATCNHGTSVRPAISARLQCIVFEKKCRYKSDKYKSVDSFAAVRWTTGFLPGTSATVTTLEVRFGRVVRRYRKKLGLAQEKLAEAAGLHRTHVSLIERGQQAPGLLVIQKFAHALGVSMAKLMAAVEAEGDAPGPEPAGPRPGRPRKS
ncbi:MAG TPA: helix-turn-helix transcriptional regulator [Gemmataceae bacterium]|nr:helix-turn-helix transcriptional regulator [Gemmataceae bacterium]